MEKNTMNISGYLEYIKTPWGRLFYRLIWHNLNFKGKKILDFGSGFGVTANHLAKCNDVTAVEPNSELLEHRIRDNHYEQIMGNIDNLKGLDDGSFDVILCHNVLEYIENRAELIAEFHRLLKKDGILSIVKHNKNGKIMHKAVFENNIDEAMALLNGENAISQNFGTINEYEIEDLKDCLAERFVLEKVYGIRTFFGIQPNSFKCEPDWEEKMFMLECAVESDTAYSNVAFFQHLQLKKK
jgi:SAM-dependent methyltransferase